MIIYVRLLVCGWLVGWCRVGVEDRGSNGIGTQRGRATWQQTNDTRHQHQHRHTHTLLVVLFVCCCVCMVDVVLLHVESSRRVPSHEQFQNGWTSLTRATQRGREGGNNASRQTSHEYVYSRLWMVHVVECACCCWCRRVAIRGCHLPSGVENPMTATAVGRLTHTRVRHARLAPHACCVVSYSCDVMLVWVG